MFQSIANDAWTTMMLPQQTQQPSKISVFSARIRRGGSYSTGGGGGGYTAGGGGGSYVAGGGGGGCQCAAETTGCPPGPPGKQLHSKIRTLPLLP